MIVLTKLKNEGDRKMRETEKAEKYVQRPLLGGNNSGDNGKNSHFYAPEASSTREKPHDDSQPQIGVAAFTSLPDHKKLYDKGFECALARGIPEGSDDDRRALTEFAEVIAESQSCSPWDPEKNAHDAEIKRENDNNERELAASSQKVKKALTCQEDSERDRANFGKTPEKPRIPWLAIVLATLFLGLGLSTSFHDGFFSDLADERLGWGFSILGGLITGVGIVYLRLGQVHNTTYCARDYLAIIGGITICLGMSLFRFWSANWSVQAIPLAVALFLTEVGLIIYIEYITYGLKKLFFNYFRVREEFDRYTALVEAAKLRVERAQQDLDALNRKKGDYINHIKDRVSRLDQIATLRRLATRTILAGYNAGLAEIEGRFHSPWVFVNDSQMGKKGRN